MLLYFPPIFRPGKAEIQGVVNLLSFFALSDDFIFSHVTVDYKMHAVLGPVIKVERKLKNEQIVVTKIKIKL